MASRTSTAAKKSSESPASKYPKSLSENPCGSQRDDGELKMQEPDVVGDFFLPADEQSPGAVEPRMRAFELSSDEPCCDAA